MQLVVLILASGRGERFRASGGQTHKLDAQIHCGLQQTTVLQATMSKAVASGLPCHLERSHHASMGRSIAAAVKANASADGWLVLPADMPLVPTEVIQAVAQGLKTAEICAPTFAGKRGHPVGFSKVCLDELLLLQGDEGARSLLKKFKVQAVSVDAVPLAQGCLIDIDTVADLERIWRGQLT